MFKVCVSKNNLNVKDFKVNLHIFKEIPRLKCDATMIANEKDNKKFDVYLKSQSLRIKNIEDFDCFLYYIYVIFHEFGHIIQYIKHPEDMIIFDEEYLAYQDTYFDLMSTKNKCREFRKATKEFGKFFDSIDAISPIEKNANKQAYLYYKDMLDQLIMYEKDEELADFYASVYTNLQDIRKDDFIFYRKYNKLQKEALNSLKTYGFDDSCVVSYD